MGWERRRNGVYYYRKVRRGGRVVSEYVPLLVAAMTDPIRVATRARDDARARLRESEREGLEADDAALAAYGDRVDLVVHAALLAAGYRRHHQGEWRKRRGPAQAQD